MIRRHVLAALAAGIEAGDDDVARKQLRRIDWLVRGTARRRLERALIDAALATNELGGGDPDAARHVQRVAALAVANAAPDDVTDRERVSAAYRALPRITASSFPFATMLGGLVAATLMTLGVLYFVTRPGPAKRAYARPLPPPAVGAFKDGGVPLADPAIEKLFIEELTALVIESDQDRQGGGLDRDRAKHSDALIAAPAIAAKGPALTKAWKAMLAMLDRWVSVPQSSKDFRDIARDFRHRVRDVSDQLAAAGIGYYLEGDVLSRSTGAHALVYTYRVEEVVFVKAGGQPRRVLSLRRLDRLNLTHSLLGMQTELGDPVLLLDQIDEHVATHVIPVLEPKSSYELGDDEWQKTDGKELAAIAGEAVRTELAGVLGKDAAAAHQIATLLAERADLVDDWRDIMHRKGWRLARTENLFLPEKMIDSLVGDVPNYQLDRARAIEEQLAQLEAPRIASRLHELVAATVRRHEAQHGLDDDRSEPLAYPDVLEDLLGDANDEDGEPRRSVERARNELSAYASQLANDASTPQLTLWNVARFGFTDSQAGTAESYAGVLLIEGLAHHLKIPSPGPVIHDRRIDRDRLAVLARELAPKTGDQLRTAGRALWKQLYDEEIVLIVDR